MGIGDSVLIKDSAPLLDRSLIGKAGYIANKLGNDYLVSFANGRSILAKKSHIELIK